MQLLLRAIQERNNDRDAAEHVFIDLLGYQDLQLLKARKGGNLASTMSNQGPVDPAKAKKRYIILTYLEKFNTDKSSANLEKSLDQSGSIKVEIEADNDKTHYPLPLNQVELDNIASLKRYDITPAVLRTLIR